MEPVLFQDEPRWLWGLLMNSWGRKLVCAYWDYNKQEELESALSDAAQQSEENSPSSVRTLRTFFHRRHQSASGSYTSNEPLTARSDTIYCLKPLMEPFQHVLHTRQLLPRWSKDRHYASRLLSFVKRWSWIKAVYRFFFYSLMFFHVKLVYRSVCYLLFIWYVGAEIKQSIKKIIVNWKNLVRKI